MTSVSDYDEIRGIIEEEYANRLSFNKANQDIYFDREPYSIGVFREIVNREHRKVLSTDKYVEELICITAKKNPFHPVEDYLNGLKKEHPEVDYHEVFRKLAEDALHIDPDSLEALYLNKTLVAAAKRVYEPGCQHDTVLVLQGGQGFYKTSFFRELAGHENFTSITLCNFNKDELMVCHSKWFIELGEVEGTIQPNKLSKLKAFVTNSMDTLRKPYAVQPVSIRRSFLLVGTTNQEKFLRDVTGNRRFWVIPVTQKIDITWLKDNRDLIWAAATKAYLDGYCTYLNETEQQLSDSINSQNYLEVDVWNELVAKWALDQQEPFILSDVMIHALKMEPNKWKRSDMNRVKAILASLGFEKPDKSFRYKGSAPQRWYKPLNLKTVM